MGSATTALPKSINLTYIMSASVPLTIIVITPMYLQVAIYDNVLILDVAVSDALAVEMVHRLDDLRKDVSCLVLRQPLVLALLDTFEQIVRGPPGKLRRRILRKRQQLLPEASPVVQKHVGAMAATRQLRGGARTLRIES